MRTLSVEDVLGPQGRLARMLPGYEHRPSQLEMARKVALALARDETLLCEAGTGTGKTLAYLVPALLSGLKVVVSTGTKTLQDQIMNHDLPLLQQVLGDELPVACMKGLGNYLCRRRYEEFRHGARSVTGAAARDLPQLQDWVERTATGDQAELPLHAGAALWSEVQSGSDTRIGPKCRFYEECFVTRMRADADRAQLLIVNHHLFFADLALRKSSGGARGAGAIPAYDAVIFDEAHLIEDIATDFFGVTVSLHRLELLLRDATRTLAAARLLPQAERLLSQLATTTGGFFSALPRAAGTEGGRLPLPPEVFDDRVREPMFALDNALDGLAAFCLRQASEGEAVAQVARRAGQLRDDVATIAEGGGRGRVTWSLTRGRGVQIGASPVDVGDTLREQLFYSGAGVVLTSATLSINGDFEFARARLGIDFPVGEALLPAPFEYAEQAALYLPQDIGDPREPGYFERACAEIRSLCALTGGGAFVLCTSLRMMRALHAALRHTLDGLVMVQGEAPNASLLERFRSAGNAVLFATASFWQGVDVPGDALRLVILDKLPFDVPTDPLVAARCERLKQLGEQPFMKYLVPSAALSLKQGFGRLIRSRRDRGIVAVLDGRLTTKGYGRVLLRSLPEARRCRSLPELREFWSNTYS